MTSIGCSFAVEKKFRDLLDDWGDTPLTLLQRTIHSAFVGEIKALVFFRRHPVTEVAAGGI